MQPNPPLHKPTNDDHVEQPPCPPPLPPLPLHFRRPPPSRLRRALPPGGQGCPPQGQKLPQQPPLLSSWEPNTDCCNWSSIFYDLTTDCIVPLYIIDGAFAPAVRLPTAIGDLAALEDLTLQNLTGLSGPIPPAIANLKNLKYITIPSYLSLVKNLAFLDLSSNKLTGSIPSWLSRTPKLRYSGLDGNRLTGPLKTFADDLCFPQDNILQAFAFQGLPSLTPPFLLTLSEQKKRDSPQEGTRECFWKSAVVRAWGKWILLTFFCSDFS
ncbi:LRRNT_2 domain-containing protein [Psidium guajava]|nr:LRRNT_2 domain-containing protein [Psidium guajava]